MLRIYLLCGGAYVDDNLSYCCDTIPLYRENGPYGCWLLVLLLQNRSSHHFIWCVVPSFMMEI